MPTTAPNHAPEVRLALAGALGAAIVAVLGALVAAVAVDGRAAVAVGGGALLVAVVGLLALPLYKLGSAAGNDMVVAMSVAALGLRVMVALIVFAVLSQFELVPMATFAIGLACGLLCALVAEMVTATRDPRFFWVQSPSPTRSDTERQLT